MKKTVLDKDESELEKEIEAGEWTPVSDISNEIGKYQIQAHNSLGKNKKINIRLSDWDYTKIKARAAQEGIPYQTLISSLIHKYLTGHLKNA